MNFVKKMAYAATIGAMTLAPVVSTQLSAAPTAASAQQATSSLVKQLSGLQRLTADFEQKPLYKASEGAQTAPSVDFSS